jgi:hypothetical protein
VLHVYPFFGERYLLMVYMALTLALKPCGLSFAQLFDEFNLLLEPCEIAIALLF